MTTRGWVAALRVAGRYAVALIVLAGATVTASSSATAEAPLSESSRLVAALQLQPGMVAADVGAGEGEWTEALARAVGPQGHVFSTEIETGMVDDLRARMERQGLANVTAVLGNQVESGLPPACCDGILLRMVYHHFENPSAMRISLRRALRRNGYLAIVDINPQKDWRRLEDVPERGGHGIAPGELILEMASDGFELVDHHDQWNGDEDRYCVVFQPRIDDDHSSN